MEMAATAVAPHDHLSMPLIGGAVEPICDVAHESTAACHLPPAPMHGFAPLDARALPPLPTLDAARAKPLPLPPTSRLKRDPRAVSGRPPLLPWLPPTALLLIGRSLEYPQLVEFARVCRGVRVVFRRWSLRRLGPPMVVSALLSERAQATVATDRASRRFRRLRALGLSLYAGIMGISLPLLLLLGQPVAVVYLALVIGLGLAAVTPLDVPSAVGSRERHNSRVAPFLRFLGRDEIYTTAQWRLLRDFWICHSAAWLFCPLLLMHVAELTAIGLAAPWFAFAACAVRVRIEYVRGALPTSVQVLVQLWWVSALQYSVLSGVVGLEARWVAHLGCLVAFPWAAATIVFAPRALRSFERGPTPTHVGAAAASGGSGSEATSPPPSWRRRRHCHVSSAVLASRLAVLWVLLPLFLEVSLRVRTPLWLLALPPVPPSCFAIVMLWGPELRRLRRHGRGANVVPLSPLASL
eukprot:NODE_4426_length_1893_cov_5.473386.p1 GENE.NODE_4426_length_1893_cov_5.473386~~NODE_4426_length_1893_cov_5.473386.p1  ORF type:complete len:467 (+),score=136.13 NODE_4426_length_1893_cov_5.473386:234-1634(+)